LPLSNKRPRYRIQCEAPDLLPRSIEGAARRPTAGIGPGGAKAVRGGPAALTESDPAELGLLTPTVEPLVPAVEEYWR
jgi:hypothetical protein